MLGGENKLKFFKGKPKEIEKAGIFTSVFDSFSALSHSKKSVPTRNKKQLLTTMHNNPWLFLAVDIIAKQVASAEFLVKRTYKNQETEELSDHPFLTILNKPNKILLGFNQFYVIQALLELAGEALILKERDDAGNLLELYVVNSNSIISMPTATNMFWKLRAGPHIIDVYITEAVYIKNPDVSNIYGRGIGRAQALSDEIAIHEYSGKQISEYFYNDAIPNYLIALEGASKDQAQRVKDDWLSRNGGWVQKYLPHFISGKMTVQKLQSEFKDMELAKLRDDQKKNIMEFFQIPPELYGHSQQSNRATSNIAETNFAKQVLVPRLDLLCDSHQVFLDNDFTLDKNVLKEELIYKSVVPRDKEFELAVKEKFIFAFNLNELRRTGGATDVAEFENIYPVPMGVKLTKFEDLGAEDQEAIKSFKTIKTTDDLSLSELLGIFLEIDFLDSEAVNKVYYDLFGATVERLKDTFGLAIDFNITNPLVIAKIKAYAGDRIKIISKTLKKELRNELIEGYQEGEGATQLMKRLNDNVFKGVKSGYELERIARTETMTSTNAATFDGMKMAGVEDKKWLATKGPRTRDSHAHLDGEIIGIDEYFVSISGDRALAPGMFSTAEENIQCRCTLAPKVSTKSADSDWKQQQEDAAIGAETAFKRAFKKYFQNIQLEINRKLKVL